MLLVHFGLGEIPQLCKLKQANLTDQFVFYQYCIYIMPSIKLYSKTVVQVYGFDDVSEKDLHIRACLASRNHMVFV